MPKCNASVRIEYNDFTTPLYQLLHLVPLFLFQWAILSLFFVYFRSFHKKFNQLMWKYVSPASSLGFKLTTSCTSVFSQNHSLSPVLDSNSQPLATSVFSQNHSLLSFSSLGFELTTSCNISLLPRPLDHSFLSFSLPFSYIYFAAIHFPAKKFSFLRQKFFLFGSSFKKNFFLLLLQVARPRLRQRIRLRPTARGRSTLATDRHSFSNAKTRTRPEESSKWQGELEIWSGCVRLVTGPIRIIFSVILRYAGFEHSDWLTNLE